MISLLMKTEYQIKRIQLLIRSAILAQENKILSSMYLFFYNLTDQHGQLLLPIIELQGKAIESLPNLRHDTQNG